MKHFPHTHKADRRNDSLSVPVFAIVTDALPPTDHELHNRQMTLGLSLHVGDFDWANAMIKDITTREIAMQMSADGFLPYEVIRHNITCLCVRVVLAVIGG